MWTKCEICDDEFDDCGTRSDICETCQNDEDEKQNKIERLK